MQFRVIKTKKRTPKRGYTFAVVHCRFVGLKYMGCPSSCITIDVKMKTNIPGVKSLGFLVANSGGRLLSINDQHYWRLNLSFSKN
jgi:hypothetical protein